MVSRIEDIASVCHEANRAYCRTLGDFSQGPWISAPDWQKQSAIAGVKLHLETLANGEELTGESAHDALLQ